MSEAGPECKTKLWRGSPWPKKYFGGRKDSEQFGTDWEACPVQAKHPFFSAILSGLLRIGSDSCGCLGVASDFVRGRVATFVWFNLHLLRFTEIYSDLL